jgi:hypothetical protein
MFIKMRSRNPAIKLAISGSFFPLAQNDEIFVGTCQRASVLSRLATAHEVAAIVASYLV